MKFRDLSRKRDYIAICRGKLSISRFFAEKRRFRDLSRKIANIAISTPPRQTNAPDRESISREKRKAILAESKPDIIDGIVTLLQNKKRSIP